MKESKLNKILIEFQEMGLISIDLKGHVHTTRFGHQVWKRLKAKGMI